MKKKLYTVESNQNLKDAAQIMWEQDCGWVPIIDSEGRIVASITDRDIAMAAYISGKLLDQIPVSDAQSSLVYKCKQDDDISDAESIMSEKQVRRLPVVNRQDKPIGLVSLNDIALAYQSGKRGIDAESVSTTLAQISGRRQSGRAIPPTAGAA